MINKFKKDLRGASVEEIMLFNAMKFLVFIRLCVYLASFFVKFEKFWDRFSIIDYIFWAPIAIFSIMFSEDTEEDGSNVWGIVSWVYFFNLIHFVLVCIILVQNLSGTNNSDLVLTSHYFIICFIDAICFCLIRLNNKKFKKRDKLKKEAPKENNKTNLSYNELKYGGNQCYILSKKVEYDMLAIFSGLSKEEQDILRPTLKKILDLFCISYDSDNFVITDHELFYDIIDFSNDLNDAVRVYKEDKTLSDISYLKKLEKVSKEFFCNLNEKKQTERKIKLEKTIGKLKIALYKI